MKLEGTLTASTEAFQGETSSDKPVLIIVSGKNTSGEQVWVNKERYTEVKNSHPELNDAEICTLCDKRNKKEKEN